MKSSHPSTRTSDEVTHLEHPEEQHTSMILLIIRVVLMAAAALAVAWPLTTAVGCFFCVLGASVGVVLGSWLGASRVRHWVLIVASALGFFLAQALAGWTVSWGWPTALFGGRGAVECAEIARWGLGAFCLLTLLRSSSHRYPSVGTLELLFPLLAAASLFSAHREGNIHRPQQLVDFALERGQEPTWYLQMLGVAASVFLAIGLLRLRKGIQFFGGLALILLMMMGMFFISSRVSKSTLVSMKQKFGKTGKEKAKPQGGQGGTSRKKRNSGQSSKKNSKRKKNMQFQPPQRKRRDKQRPVAVVLFKNDYRPPSNIYYFRQRVLSQFNGVRFVQSARGDVDRDRVLHFPVLNTRLRVRTSVQRPKGIQRLGAWMQTKKTKKNSKGKQLSTRALLGLLRKEQKGLLDRRIRLTRVETIVAVMYDHRNPFGLVSPQSFRGLPNPNPGVFLRSFSVRSLAWEGSVFPKFRITKDAHLPFLLQKHFPLLEHSFGESWWPASAKAYYTRPPTDPRYRTLLTQILKPLQGHPVAHKAFAKLYAIKYWLQKNAVYSMRLRPPADVRDHVAHFLFKTRIGYCVHFSHAAVYLARIAGIPARVAEGYAVPGKERGTGSSLLIRAGAAHAWPEVYIRGLGWTVFDIYPQRNLDTQRPTPPDPNQRKMLASLARPKKIPPLRKGATQDVRKARTRWSWKGVRWWLDLPWHWLPVALLLILFGVKWWRRWAYIWSGNERKTLLFLRHMEDRLSEQGYRREMGETLEHFGERFVGAMPSLIRLFQHVSAMHLGSRLTQGSIEPTLLASIAKEYRSFIPWYNQFLRFLDPLSWFGHIWQRWQYFPPVWWLKWLDVWERINTLLNRALFLFRRAR